MTINNKKNAEWYCSVDIESDGPLPGPNSMLSLGAAAFDGDTYQMVDTFSVNFDLLPGAKQDESTLEFWAKHRTAYDLTRVDTKHHILATNMFVNWVEGLPGKPAFVAYPAGFDFTWVYTYMKLFVGRSPFSFSAIDIKTYAMAMLKKNYRDSTKRNMPKSWFSKSPHRHEGLADAIEQGELFMNMLRYNREG